MKQLRAGLACFTFAFTLSLTAAVQAQSARNIPDVSYQKFVLDNGLTLIVHEDHKAPIVAVNVWYHVGSKNEPDGKSGFAHLFEHLMFNGSENYNDDYFNVLERIGATDLNGTTNEDRTNYFQNVPVGALDRVLWMESDRMGHLLGAVDQARLDEQRGVVQNEKRQWENEPYERAWNHITEATWPKGHPYAHTVIGSMEDLTAASLEDVHEWFKTFYGPNNAVLVIAGAIDTEAVLEKVEHYFGDIPPGPPTSHFDSWVVELQSERRETMQDRVPQARIYKVWNVPPLGTLEYNLLSIVDRVLTEGKTSRLYKRLVYEDRIATDVNFLLDGREIGSQVVIYATAQPGQTLPAVEQALDEELERFLVDGPTPEEISRAQTSSTSDFVRGLQRIGGFGGKSDVLAQSEVYLGSPDGYKSHYEDVLAATPSDVRDVASRWLGDGVYVLEVNPYPELAPAAEGADRSTLPPVAEAAEPEFPDLQRTTLSNGMEIILAERHSVPLVEMELLIDAGFAADQGIRMGTADLTMDMMDEGTTTRSALELSDQMALLGAEISTAANLDQSSVTLSALRQNLDASLDLFTDVVLNPSFPPSELERIRQQQLASIQREKVTPIYMALRVFPRLIYGEDHPYGLPFTGSGTEASVREITREDLAAFHERWFKPNNATLIVVGDVTMTELEPMLESRFKGWIPGDVPRKNVADIEQPEGGVLYLIDRPGSIQSMIIAGHLAPKKSSPNEVAFETMNTVLGGAFTSRVNMNLREAKGWSYGAFTFVPDARGQRPYIFYAPVQTDKTKEAIQELQAELEGIRGARPIEASEIELAKNSQTLTLAGQWETLGAVRSSIAQIVRYGLPDTHFEDYPDEVRALNEEDLMSSAQRFVLPDHTVWVVVGDRKEIEPNLRELGFSEIRTIDSDGKDVM